MAMLKNAESALALLRVLCLSLCVTRIASCEAPTPSLSPSRISSHRGSIQPPPVLCSLEPIIDPTYRSLPPFMQKPGANLLIAAPSRPSLRAPQLEEIRFDRKQFDEIIDIQSLARDPTSYFARLPRELLSLIQRFRDAAAIRYKNANQWKVVVNGDAGVGKSALVKRLVHGTFEEAVPEEPTRDAVIEGLSVQLGSSKERIPLTITYWRPAAMRFRLPVDRKTHVIIVTFDLCNKESFEHVRQWMQEHERYTESPMWVICGTKSDLKEMRVIDAADARDFADSKNVPYIETSAKDDINVTQLFQQACLLICNRYDNKWGVPVEPARLVVSKQDKGCVLQ